MKFDPTSPSHFYKALAVELRLKAPAVSVHFQWTAQQIVSLASQGGLYSGQQGARGDLNVYVCIHTFEASLSKPQIYCLYGLYMCVT